MSEAAPLTVPAGARRPGFDIEPMPPLNDATFMQAARGWTRVGAFAAMTLIMIPVQSLMIMTKAGRKFLPRRFHRVLAWVFGMRITVHGELARKGGLLIVANHTSWLDIIAISTVTPLSFVGKSQIKNWGLFAVMAKMQETIFIERERRAKTAEQRDQIIERLAQGDTIVLFPEGTSSDGNQVLPFKSALMSAAQGEVPLKDGSKEPITVQPMSVAYTKVQGMPMTRQWRPFFAWYGDMEMWPHLPDSLRIGPCDVEITLHPPITLKQAGSRKALAEHCETLIHATVARSLAGRG